MTRASLTALLLTACAPRESWPLSGVTHEVTITATPGSYDLRMDGGMVMATLDGYHLNDQFLGPTLVGDLGDRFVVTLVNQTDAMMGLHPHGVHYDKENEGVMQTADPGGEITYTWDATQGPGTFPYHSHELDEELREYQGLAGVLGAIVIRDPEEERKFKPDLQLNYFMTNVYSPWTTFNPDAMESPAPSDTDAADTDAADTDAHAESDPTTHNHTMVVQEVRQDDQGTWNTVTQDLLTARAKVGQTVRVNLIGFGTDFHTFHTHGYAWHDLQTGELLDVKSIGPAETYHFYLPDMSNPGLWMVHCHVDAHLHMMTTYLLVEK